MPAKHFTLLAAFAALSFAAANADTKIADAVMRGDREAVRTLLQRHADVNVPQPDGTTALHWAAHANDLETADLLIRAGAKAGTVNEYGDTPLSEASTNGNPVMIEKLLKVGADPNQASAEGETALMTAARTGNAAVVRLLLEHGAKVDAKEEWRGDTALMLAAAENHPDAIQSLIQHGADVNARSRVWPAEDVEKRQVYAADIYSPAPRGGLTPLLFAARQGSVDAIRALTAAGADLNLTDPDGTSPLVVAIINAHYDAAALLLDKGADPNISDQFGRAPLYAAVDMHTLDWSTRPAPKEANQLDSLDVVKSALAHGANPNARLTKAVEGRGTLDGHDPLLNEGATPFIRAAKSSDVTVMRLLLDKGADPKLETKEHNTALMAAAGEGWREARSRGSEADSIEAIKLCMSLGNDINAVNDKGEAAVHGAAFRRANQVIAFLAANGAKLDGKDKKGRTPLDIASSFRVLPAGGNNPETTMALLHQLLGPAHGTPASSGSVTPVP